tara:strand:+ start:670 stop:1722 length:1053 start_codon:yes stop_codon:yes gene_type:complete
MAYTTINKSTDHFNTKLYTGTTNGQSITAVGHQPSFTWIKDKDAAGGYSHMLFDAVRGVGKRIRSNSNVAEYTYADTLTSFDSDGFTLGADSNTTEVNRNGANYVSWNWKANGSGSSNTAGSINSTVSANTTSGCSIVKWTGTASNATVGHGLGIAPELVFYKYLGTAGWYTYAKHAIGNNGAVGRLVVGFLENTAAFTNDLTSFQSTDPSSTLLYVGAGANLSGANIAYCFASVQGFSKIGSYKGNGNDNGSFIYTGFKPAWVLIKRSSAAGDQWQLSDNKRGINGAIKTLYPDSTEVETSGDSIDFLSNGFKNKSSSVARNGSGSTYIYMAFAEAPLVGSNNIPATAR